MNEPRASEELVNAVVGIAEKAGEDILAIYEGEGAIGVRLKADNSPVTAADDAAERRIGGALRRLTPDIPVISEEAVAKGCAPGIAGGRFWLVDPLDGTKEFLKRNDEFTVNIALVEGTRPVLGVVHAPALRATYWAAGRGTARARRDGVERPIESRPPPKEGLVVLVSRSHGDPASLDDFLANLPVRARWPAGSSLKFCLIAAGEADLYPRFGRTMEWDVAAGHVILAAAGGSVSDLAGADIAYGKPGFENPPFVARGKTA